MNIGTKTRFALWLAGTLVIGALGNGLWELAKPALLWAGSATLDIATLGLTSLRDAIYVEIAKGTYERAAEKVLSILLGLVTGAGIILLMASTLKPRAAASRLKPEVRRTIFWAMNSVLAIFVLTMLVQNYRIIYIVRAANHMEQLLRVVAPVQTEQERLIYVSRFASMQNREQYQALTTELSEIARKNKLPVPDFDIY